MSFTDREVIDLIEETLSVMPERMSGNEANPLVAEKLRRFSVSDKAALLGALTSYLSFRIPRQERHAKDGISESRIWMALDVADRLRLTELAPVIADLREDVRRGEVFMPIHEESVARYLDRLSK